MGVYTLTQKNSTHIKLCCLRVIFKPFTYQQPTLNFRCPTGHPLHSQFLMSCNISFRLNWFFHWLWNKKKPKQAKKPQLTQCSTLICSLFNCSNLQAARFYQKVYLVKKSVFTLTLFLEHLQLHFSWRHLEERIFTFICLRFC